MLNVTMHWYGFQMLTMRFSFSSGDSTLYTLRERIPVLTQLLHLGGDLLVAVENAQSFLWRASC